jgi:hypothetical protein
VERASYWSGGRVTLADIGPFPLDQIGEIARTGLLGVVCVLLLTYIWYLVKQLAASQAARIADWKEIAEIVKAQTLVMANWTAANEVRTRAIEGTVRAQEMTAGAITQLANEVRSVGERSVAALESNQAMREALLSQGVKL